MMLNKIFKGQILWTAENFHEPAQDFQGNKTAPPDKVDDRTISALGSVFTWRWPQPLLSIEEYVHEIAFH